MNTDIVELPDSEEFASGVQRAFYPHLVPERDKFVDVFMVRVKDMAGQQVTPEYFAGVLVDVFTSTVKTNGAAPQYGRALLKQVVDEFTKPGTIARENAYQRIDRMPK